MMNKRVALVLVLLASSNAQAVTKSIFANNLALIDTKDHADLDTIKRIEDTIQYLSDNNPANLRLHMDAKKRHAVARAVYIASVVNDVDWKLLVAISYVESGICTTLKGDKKHGKSGAHLFHWWSVGCMQVNTRWWGPVLSDIGLTQEDLLDIDVNIMVAAAILKHYQNRFGFWGGVRRYNGIGKRADRYLEKVKSIYYFIGGDYVQQPK